MPPVFVPGCISMNASQDPGSLGVYGLRNRADYSYNFKSIDSASIPTVAIWDHLAQQGKKSIVVAPPIVYPSSLRTKLTRLLADVNNLGTNRKTLLKDEFFEMSCKHWQVVCSLMKEQEWDYFHFVDVGLARMHRVYENNESHIVEYCRLFDEQISSVLDMVDDETIVLLVSNPG